jgi:MinD-like ATPase involved in chromosome partitioning or flagellar assembly
MTAGAAVSMIISGLLGSASGITHELTTSDTLLRSPLAVSRRVGFVQLRGGSGASSTAGYVASMLARRRAGMVLAVNASAGEANLLWHAGLTRPAGGATEHPRNALSRAHPGTAADARAGLPVTGTGLIALDLARDHLATSAGTWFEQITPIARFYDLVITDWGLRHRQVDLRQVARASHVMCLVSRADRYPAEEAAALIPALSEVEDQPRVVLALVDVGRTADYTPQLLRSQLQVPVLAIPYEPLRAAARPVGSRHLPARTRLAYTRLCTALMAEAVRPDYRRLVAPRPQQSQPAPVAGGEQP